MPSTGFGKQRGGVYPQTDIGVYSVSPTPHHFEQRPGASGDVSGQREAGHKTMTIVRAKTWVRSWLARCRRGRGAASDPSRACTDESCGPDALELDFRAAGSESVTKANA